MGYPLATSSPLVYVGLGVQSVKGTGVTPTLFVPYRSAVSLDHGQAGDDIFEAGTGPYMNRKMKTAHDPNGSFGLGCRPATIAEICALFLGDDAITGAGAPYTHTLTVEEAARIWVTVEQAAGTDGDIIERFVDAVLKSLTLSVEGNGDLMAQVAWTALSPAWQATASTPTYESGLAGSTPGGPFRGAEAVYTIDSSAEVNVQSFEAALEWTYDEDIRLSKVTRGEFIKLSIGGTVKVKQLLNDTDTRDAYRKIAYNGAAATAADPNFFGAGDMTVVFNNGLSTTNERELSIAMPEIDWTSAKYTDLDPAGQTLYVEREGTIKKVAGTEFVTVVGKTADSSAYVS